MTLRVWTRKEDPNDLSRICRGMTPRQAQAVRQVLARTFADLLHDDQFLAAANRAIAAANGGETVEERQARRMRLARMRAGVERRG